ncbi:polysaccharide biosynthesis C-terminal domain-containing protein [Neptuniibacter marinus]|uniref:oligosaccharide flippase family protein n=1 Tax=Neptuniibacter marinus TaxID=1806670 RepID=UPI003B5B497F
MLKKLERFSAGSRLRRNISTTFGRQMLGALVQFLIIIIIARELGPVGNGIYALVILLPSMLVSLLNLGVAPATVFYVSRKDFDSAYVVVGNLRIALVISLLGIIVMLPILWFWGGRVFPSVPITLLYIGLFSFPLTLLLSYLNAVFQGQENFKVFNCVVLIPPCLNLFFISFAIYVFDFSLSGAILSYFLSQLAGLVIVFVFLCRDGSLIKIIKNKLLLSLYIRGSLSYGCKMHLSNVLAFINYRADIFFVNIFLNPAATGVYVIAVQIAERIWMVSQAASTVLLPRLSAMQATPKARMALTNKAFIVVSLMTAGLSGLVTIGLYWLLEPIFGDAYVNSWLVYIWLLPGVIAGAGARIYSNCIAAAGKPEWNMYVACVVVSINIIGNILLIPEHGIIGAAWATSIAYCCNAIFKVWLVKKTLYV